MVFDYSALPREFTRKYLPSGLKFEWGDLSKVYVDLSSRTLGSVSDLEKWLADESELDSYIYEQRTIRYINSTRQTDNPEFTRAYEQYVEELEPRLKVAKFGLLEKYVTSKFRAYLPQPVYGM